MTIAGDAQKLNPGDQVELFILEGIDGTTYYITSADGDVSFGSQSYTRYPIKASGFSKSSSGTIPQPTITLADVSGYFSGLVQASATSDLLGSKVTRIRTLKKHLDDGSEPDSTAKFPDEVYYIERKTGQNKYMITWALASSMDLYGTQFPKRLILKNLCTHTYRLYINAAFVPGTCKYTGGDYFDKDGNVEVAPGDDVCGKRLTDCRLRFLQPLDLPTRAFPGVHHVRI